ncbi:MAG TPA: 2-C-methyl-D-erythritol 4-phosphate cytidylyltransferase [Terriglobales bacterium]|nr:2-C-methyl-D-erythritol 4-phosphate cytidylyltransferase [Terriglobales bacterium]
MRVFVIIPAAGLGTRMAGAATTGRTAKPSAATLKQFAELGGAPIVILTLRKFAAVPKVDEIYVALRKSEIPGFRTRLDQEKLRKPVHLVEGGEHRQQSVANALEAIKAAPEDIILVHDAVRPFVDSEIIQSVIEAAARHGAAIAAVPAVDTVKQVDRTAEGAVVNTTIPREHIVLVQTPQGFRYHVIRDAFHEATRDGFTGTDESSLVERSGHQVAVVMGSARNLKITTPSDLELAEFYLSLETRRPLAG